MTAQIFHDHAADRPVRRKFWTRRLFKYRALAVWAFMCLFPIYWTATTAFKSAPDVMKGNMIPWWDFTPTWLGFRKLGLSPDSIFEVSTAREEFLRRFTNSIIIWGVSSFLAVCLGTIGAYGLSRFEYRFLWMKIRTSVFSFLAS